MNGGKDCPWTTLWDRKNRRVLLLAGRKSAEGGNGTIVVHDQSSSVAGIYDIWRTTPEVSGHDTSSTPGDVVFVELYLGDDGQPLGFPVLAIRLPESGTISGPDFKLIYSLALAGR